MEKIIARMVGYQCTYCGVIFQAWETHPPTLEFINGYPSPCRKIGCWMDGYYKNRNDLPWIRLAIREEIVDG